VATRGGRLSDCAAAMCTFPNGRAKSTPQKRYSTEADPPLPHPTLRTPIVWGSNLHRDFLRRHGTHAGFVWERYGRSSPLSIAEEIFYGGRPTTTTSNITNADSSCTVTEPAPSGDTSDRPRCGAPICIAIFSAGTVRMLASYGSGMVAEERSQHRRRDILRRQTHHYHIQHYERR
jgi:hypothetical protein